MTSVRSSGRLAGKRALVTAAGAGIGRATALAFAAEGATVIATDIDGAGLDALVASFAALGAEGSRASALLQGGGAADGGAVAGSVRGVRLDVTDPVAIAAVVAEAGAVDILFNCAGYVHAGTLLDTDDAGWRRSFAINVDSMFHTCRAVLPGMLERGTGSIVNMSSVASSIKGVPNRFAYGTTKAAVIGLTRSIAADYVGRGVRCNAICPGTVKTPSLGERVRALGGDEAAAWRGFTERQPMGRLGDPREIAALALYLASDESSFTTGTIHVVDGGWSN
ncbi:MAG TPA: SDR family oxidoreductase [Luteibacter sp.]|jgi:2-keto-3-deoxy-L-fuconate dehydrogenase|uniref:SDR family oxidoreductase n=1 Tax=Luteibacter sp. TaxID=1886636 RepID=UPI002F3F4024